MRRAPTQNRAGADKVQTELAMWGLMGRTIAIRSEGNQENLGKEILLDFAI